MIQMPKALVPYAKHLKEEGYNVTATEESIITEKDGNQVIFVASEVPAFLVAMVKYELNDSKYLANKLEALEMVNSMNTYDIPSCYIGDNSEHPYLAITWTCFGEYNKDLFHTFLLKIDVDEITIIKEMGERIKKFM